MAAPGSEGRAWLNVYTALGGLAIFAGLAFMLGASGVMRAIGVPASILAFLALALLSDRKNRESG